MKTNHPLRGLFRLWPKDDTQAVGSTIKIPLLHTRIWWYNQLRHVFISIALVNEAILIHQQSDKGNTSATGAGFLDAEYIGEAVSIEE